jgi:hypothetical protein
MLDIFPRKLCRLKDNVEKYGGAGQATDNDIMLRRKDAICLQDNDIHSSVICHTTGPQP